MDGPCKGDCFGAGASSKWRASEKGDCFGAGRAFAMTVGG